MSNKKFIWRNQWVYYESNIFRINRKTMNAKFVMNQNTSNFKNNPSDMSQDMLYINGELDSGMGMQRDSSNYYNQRQNHHQPNHYQNNHQNQQSHYRQPSASKQQHDYQNHVAVSRANFNRMGHALENLEPIKDELRKKPFTVPVVKVELPIETPLVEQSNVKTGHSQMRYIDWSRLEYYLIYVLEN